MKAFGAFPERPRLVLSASDLVELREHVESEKQPWKWAWENLQKDAERYMAEKFQPMPYFGPDSKKCYDVLMRDAYAARDLAIAYYASGEKRYAEKAAMILAAWLPREGPLPGTAFDPELNYSSLGMLAARSIFPYLYAYDLLKGGGMIPEGADARLEEWLRSRAEQIREGARRWKDNDYFDKQYYQNHIVADAMGLMAIGITLGDEQMVRYAVDSPGNERDLKDLIAGIILMEGEKPYYREPGDWPVQTGEIADRYRHFEIGGHYKDYVTKPNRGLQYCGLSTTLLMIAAEMGRLNGIDLWGYVAPGGETLRLPLEFYSGFYYLKSDTIQGGFYTGEKPWINGNESCTWTMWEVGNKRLPGEKKFEAVLEANRGGKYMPLHLLGPVALTHAVALTPEQEMAALKLLPWKTTFEDGMRGDWQEKWHLDGEVGTVKTSPKGLEMKAGPQEKNNADHMVLWAKPEFKGPVRIEYDFTRLDKSKAGTVNIIYLMATGSGQGPYKEDIFEWNDLRKVPAMATYFDHMNAYHISYATVDPEGSYVRARRYMPLLNKGLNGTALTPEYIHADMFKPGVKYHITVIQHGDRLFLEATGKGKTELFWFDTSTLPPLDRGRVGLRLMWTRNSLFSDFSVGTLE